MEIKGNGRFLCWILSGQKKRHARILCSLGPSIPRKRLSDEKPSLCSNRGNLRRKDNDLILSDFIFPILALKDEYRFVSFADVDLNQNVYFMADAVHNFDLLAVNNKCVLSICRRCSKNHRFNSPNCIL